MKKLIAKLLLKFHGFKVIGDVDKRDKKYISLLAPHTSNWDFFIGMSACALLDIDTNFLGKDSLFKGLQGKFFRAMGGIPVDRSKSNNLVDQVVEIFNSRDQVSVVITPEGKRAKVDGFKKGFWYIAKGANIPVYLGFIDFERKIVGPGERFELTDDIDADLEYIWNHYKQFKGKFPELGIN